MLVSGKTSSVSAVKKLFNAILNFGVQQGMASYESERLRFANLMQLFCEVFYLFYFILGLLIDAPFLSVVTLSMLVTGWMGLLFNKYRYYNLARSFFITTFCVLLFFACNSLNVGDYFLPFYFPAFISYTLYYDLEKDLHNAVVNLSVSVA